MNKHFHTEMPFLCIQGTGWGWSLSPECTSERVEPCSEVVLSGGVLLSSLEELMEELENRGVQRKDIEQLRLKIREIVKV